MCNRKYFCTLFLLAVFHVVCLSTTAQIDTTRKLTLDSIIRREKGLLGRLAKNLIKDTTEVINPDLLRNDKPFQRYKDRIIRHILIQTLEFGIPITDTTKPSGQLKGIKKIANRLHADTRDLVIRHNLFFSENEKLAPYLLGDNERQLRDLPFIQDARIRVLPVKGSRDSVDILVLTKDVLSLGGSFRLHSSESVSISVKEDNFLGWGDRIQLQGLYDLKRDRRFGQGIEYIKRNIAGSFVDGAAGFINYNKAFSNGQREEEIAYIRLTRPLVNRYMKWTYGSEIELHKTRNFYSADSIYQSDYKYKYNIVDAWGAWNMDAGYRKENDRLRRLIGLRVVQQKFSDKPLKYTDQYFYSYADLRAVLGSFSLFNQNFYKTQYIYGFGRNEDVPEGMEASVTAGWTKKSGRERPFLGMDFKRYYFTANRHYFNFTVRAGTFFYKNKWEDIDVLGQVDYFSRLHYLPRKWRQRFFLNGGITKQINSLLNEPVRLESEYGLPELKNNFQNGNFRITIKGESVFFSPWSVLLFRFAPFVFGNASYLNLKTENINDPKLYAALGAGVRIRNESLIFGTTEFRGMFFPRKNFNNDSWRFEVRTNIRFKYNQEFIKRPEFIRVN